MVIPSAAEWISGWGESDGAVGYPFRPSTIDGIRACLELAAAEDIAVAPRGAGCSYGDAALLPEGVILDCERMQRILSWDPESGIIDVEPGVTIRRIWRYVLGDGWWPPVVTGTMETTAGGCFSMNVHGKNNWVRGTFFEHCLEVDLLSADGTIRTVKAAEDPALLSAIAGSYGLLGILTRLRLRMKKISSGLLEVRAVSAPDLEGMLRLCDETKDDWEYVVGWIDAFPGRRKLGRGLVHLARHLEPGEDPHPEISLRIESQDLPEELFGIFPKSSMWRLLKPFANRPGMALINRLKYAAGATVGNGAHYFQSLAEFSFLLDYVPNWKKIYAPGGLIQHQSFVPTNRAEEVFRRQFESCRREGMPSFLAVLKRHRPDGCLLGHGVDGFSLALDFPVRSRARTRLWKLVEDLARPVVEAGGRFYPAKDSALPGDLYRATLREGQLARFLALKKDMDPEGRFNTALAGRLLGVER